MFREVRSFVSARKSPLRRHGAKTVNSFDDAETFHDERQFRPEIAKQIRQQQELLRRCHVAAINSDIQEHQRSSP